MTKAVYEQLIALGPLLDTRCITCIDFDEEALRVSLEQYLKPGIKDLMSDTVLLRIAYLQHRGFELEQAIFLAFIRGLKLEYWPEHFKTLEIPKESEQDYCVFHYFGSGVIDTKRIANRMYLSKEDASYLSVMPSL